MPKVKEEQVVLSRISKSTRLVRQKSEHAMSALRQAADAVDGLSDDADAAVVAIGAATSSLVEEARANHARIVDIRDGLLEVIDPSSGTMSEWAATPPRPGRKGRPTSENTLASLMCSVKQAASVKELPDLPFDKDEISTWTPDEKRVHHAHRVRLGELAGNTS